MDDGFLLWSELQQFYICLSNLHPSIKYTSEKAKVARDQKGNLVKILSALDVNVILNSKNEISTDVYFRDTNTHDYLPYDSAHPESSKKKNMFYNLAKRTVVFVTDPEKVELRLWNLATNNKYPDHIISNAFQNAKLQGPAPKPKKKCQQYIFCYNLKQRYRSDYKEKY